MKFAGSKHRRCAGTCPAESFPYELRPEDSARKDGKLSPAALSLEPGLAWAPRSLEGSGQCGTFGGSEWDGEQLRAPSSSLLSRLGSWLFLEPQYHHQTEFCGSQGPKDLREFGSTLSLNL